MGAYRRKRRNFDEDRIPVRIGGAAVRAHSPARSALRLRRPDLQGRLRHCARFFAAGLRLFTAAVRQTDGQRAQKCAVEAARPPLPLRFVKSDRQRSPRAHERYICCVPALAVDGHRAAARGDRLPAKAAEKAAAGLCARCRGLVPSLRHGRPVGLWLG